MIRLHNVEKSFPAGGGRTFVLRQIELGVDEGEFVSIMGPSGSGKTTLLSILGMLDADWTGEYEFLGQSVHRMKPKERAELNKKNIGFVFQQYHLLDNLTVRENLDVPLSYRNVKSSERAALVADTLDRFRIVGKKDLFPVAALRGSAAARRRRASPDRETEAHPRRRTDRKPPLRPGAGDHGPVSRIERLRHDDRSGDPLRHECGVRKPDRPAPRRMDPTRLTGAAKRGMLPDDEID